MTNTSPSLRREEEEEEEEEEKAAAAAAAENGRFPTNKKLSTKISY